MIKKRTEINDVDGTNYDIKIVAGPFERESQAKKVAKAWSEPDSSESSFENESPVQPVTKKRKETAKCSRKLENDFLKLPVPPTLPLSARGTTVGGSPLMSSDLISVSHDGSSPISESNCPISNCSYHESAVSCSGPISSSILVENLNNTKTSSTKLGPLLCETITHESYSKSESSPRLMIKKKQESAVSHSNLTSSSTPIDNLKRTTTSNTELELLLSDRINESNPNSGGPSGPNTDIRPFFEAKSNAVYDMTNMSEDCLKTSTTDDDVGNLVTGSLMLLDGSTSFQEINYTDSNVYDNFDSTLINNEETNNTNTTDSGLMDLSNFISKNENCCCQNLLQIKSILATNEKTSKAVHKQIMIQLHMLNNSNVKIVNAMKNMDQKLQVIMKADSRMRSLALPIPVLPTALITLLPAKCIEEVDVVESILSDDIDGLNNQEELKSYLYMKIGSMDSISSATRAAINECFKYNVLAFFSFRGKTKRSFSKLKLCTVIYESLSSFRTHFKDEEKFNRTVDNYIKHSKQNNED
ncbi:uncharacterized protein LOC111039930, partial [Myzus persicae]|uniref:uncharacterized protein LOC111039930 n=1 Tax=Myzus persicae TaxID=13164 RepID=UPI000B930022